MYWTSTLIPVIVAGFPSWANGQESGWQEGQVTATMCAWRQFRAALLKDTVYMDGGDLYWRPELADGTFAAAVIDNNPLGLIHTLNFSHPFDSSTNVSSILNRISLGSEGVAVNNIAPNTLDGAMLANERQFFLYGGLPQLNIDTTKDPTFSNVVLSYQASSYGVEGQEFKPGFSWATLPKNMTQYVTFGGAANAPSEDKAWYFGGSRSDIWGPIYQMMDNETILPTNVSNTFVTLEFPTAIDEKPTWKNVTLPPNIPGRASPSVVWVPVGKQGILVVLGGVSYPDYATTDDISLNIAQSMKDGPRFMSNIDIYDVAGNAWYQQPTVGAPPALALGCAVVAPARDFSSYNVYYYGGYDGVHSNGDYNDDVWVLSLPSFVWKKISSGNQGHARIGHQCVMPYPDQMVTIGGFRPPHGAGDIPCLEGGILQVFNLTEGKWLDSYDPSKWNEYGVPEIVHREIGGDYSGGATLTTPTPSGWATPGLAQVFATKYPASKITTYYPYSSQDAGNGARPPADGDNGDSGKGGKGGNRRWLAPVLGVVLGLVFVTIIAVGIVLYRRRKLLWKKERRVSENPTDDSTHIIRNWLNNTHEKEPTITTENQSSYLDGLESRNETPMRMRRFTDQVSVTDMGIQEMPETTQRFELMDTSHPVELSSGDGQSYDHTDNAATTKLDPVLREKSSNLSSSQAADPAIAANPPVMSQVLPNSTPSSQNSNPLPATNPNRRTSSGEVSHLRNLSGQTMISSMSNPISGPLSPATPPPNDREAVDYMNAQRTQNPLGQQENAARASPSRSFRTSPSIRTSMFRENVDDLGDSPTQSRMR